MLGPGDVIANSIRLEHQLGKGGMGSVWVGHHLRLGGQVAVKLMSAELISHPDARARFEREARLIAQVRSPHVVQVHDYGVTEGDDGSPYIVMELLDGEDLAHKLERERTLQAAALGEILEQLCEVLGEAHRGGIIHRDIKPANVFLVRSRRPFIKVLDFGVARTGDAGPSPLTQTGLMLGTAHYMSPEQLFKGKDIDCRSDLWAVGVLAYEALTAHYPFDAETFGALCLKVQEARFKPVREFHPALAPLDAWFARALATDREQRFATAEALREGFTQALSAMDTQRGYSHDPSAFASTAVVDTAHLGSGQGDPSAGAPQRDASANYVANSNYGAQQHHAASEQRSSMAHHPSDAHSAQSGYNPNNAPNLHSGQDPSGAYHHSAGWTGPSGVSGGSVPTGPGATAHIPHVSAHTPMPVEARDSRMMGSESKAVLALEPKPARNDSATGWWLSAGAFVVLAVGATVGLRLYQEANARAQDDSIEETADSPAAETTAADDTATTDATPSADLPPNASPTASVQPSVSASQVLDQPTPPADAGAAGSSPDAPDVEATAAPQPPATNPPAAPRKPPRRAPQPEPEPEGKWGF